MTNQNNSNLKTTIIFASIMLTLALLYNGYSYSQSYSSATSDMNLEQEIQKGIENFIKKQEEEAQKAQAAAAQPKYVEGDFTDDDAVQGNADALITIIEFSDYECPFCKRFFTDTYPEIKSKYIDTNKVKYVFRDFPLGFHDPLATQEAIAAECAREQGGDKTYYQYHDLIFQTTNSNGQGMLKEKLYNLAEQAGVNRQKFKKCLDSEKYKDEVRKDLADGQKAGISGTPSFLVNGQLITGAQPFSAFEQIIEEALN